MNWTRVAGAMTATVLVACTDTSQPVAPAPPGDNAASRDLAVLAQVAQAPLTYRPEVPNGTSFYRPVAIADMNGDARPDIVIGSWSTNQVEIWTYNTTLDKAELMGATPALPSNIHGLATADVDKDGDVDILAAVRFYGVYLFVNNGGTSWTIRQLNGTYAWNVQVADFDLDGNLDVFGSLNSGATLLYGDGAGNFTAGAVPSFVSPMGVNVADFNGDGLPDLIGPDGVIGRMMAYQNLGGRTWSANLGPGNTYPNQLVSESTPSALDLYGNGNLDQVALFHDQNGYIPPMSVVIFEGSGAPASPTWAPRVLDVLPARGLPVGIADLDDDGHLDIFVGGSFGFLGFRAYRGDGQGDFTAESVPYTYGVGSRNSFAVVDFNGDGTSDIVAARHALGVDEPSQGFVILYRTRVYSCQGFDAPMNAGPITPKGNRTLPFKGQVLGENGQPLTALTPLPLVQVMFVPAGGGTAVDVSPGATFAYINGKWRYDLKTGSFTAPGSYTVSMLTGDATDYIVQPTCTATFLVE